jgi:hypothetical protein
VRSLQQHAQALRGGGVTAAGGGVTAAGGGVTAAGGAPPPATTAEGEP